MKKIIFLITLFILLAVPQRANAAQNTANPSAQLKSEYQNSATPNLFDARVKALKNVFARHNSPLTNEAANYVKYADQNNVDWKLLPAISGVESTFGNAIPSGSYNAYGWGNGKIYFESWEDGIRTITQALRTNYMNRGATDVWSIGHIYAASPTWSVRVNSFMNEINEEYLKLSTFSSIPNI